MAFAENAQLSVELLLKDNLSAALNKAKSSVSGFAGQTEKASGSVGKFQSAYNKIGTNKAASAVLSGVGVGAGIGLYTALSGAISGVVGFLTESEQAFREDQQSQAALRASLEANVAGWNGNADAIEAVLTERMKLGFADEDQRASLARLVAVTHDQTKALDLQRTAMDLARLRGIDLASASDIVGKVYGGNIGILTRYGIQLQKGVTSTEALTAVQKLAAGQAEAYANTDAGKLAVAQIKVNEAQEKLGAALSKFQAVILPAVADGITTVVDVATDLGTVLGPVLLPILGKVGDGIDLATKAIGGLADAARFVLSPIGNVTDALGGLNDAVGSIPVPWHNATQQAVADMVRLQETVGNTPNIVADDLRESASHLYAGAGAMSDAAAAGITDPIVGAAEDADSQATKIAAQTPADIGQALIRGQDEVERAGETLRDALKNPISQMKRIAALEGELAGKDLAKGLRSDDPLVRAQAEAYRQSILDELARLRAQSYTAGANTGRSLVHGLQGERASAGQAAASIRKTIIEHLPSTISTTIDVMVHYHGSSGFAAEGGFLRRPGDSLIVGEAGEPEFAQMLPSGQVQVTPFHKYRSAQMPMASPAYSPLAAPPYRAKPPEFIVQAYVTTRSVVDQLSKAKTYGSIGGVATAPLPTGS